MLESRSKIAIFDYPLLRLTPSTEGSFWDDIRIISPGYQRMAKVPNYVETLGKILTDYE